MFRTCDEQHSSSLLSFLESKGPPRGFRRSVTLQKVFALTSIKKVDIPKILLPIFAMASDLKFSLIVTTYNWLRR